MSMQKEESCPILFLNFCYSVNLYRILRSRQFEPEGNTMTLHQLRIFAAVARYRNISKASKELHISQPAISQQLKHLEEECEQRFLHRVGHGVELTRDGRAFLDQIGRASCR